MQAERKSLLRLAGTLFLYGPAARRLRGFVPALAAALFIGTYITPANAQTTCGVNKAGTCIAYQTASISLITAEGVAVTTTDPTYTKDGPNYEGVLSISPNDVYGGNGILRPPSNGTATDNFSTGVITYTPNPGFVGTDSFVVQTGEPSSGSRVWIYTTTISVTVTAPVNPPPTVSDTSLTTAYNTAGSVTLPSSGSVTGFATASNPAHGSVSLSGSTATYTPNSGYFGSDSFTFYATGPGGASNTATVFVTVQTPPAPTANNASISTAYDTTGSTTLTASNNPTSFAIASGPSHGAASISGFTAIYTPNAGYVGSDSFTFYASNAGGSSNVATVTVSVAAPPAPTAAGGSITTPYNTPAMATLPGSGVISSYAIVSSPAHGAITLSGSSVTYTPNAGYLGPDSFTYDVTGPGGTSAPAMVSVTVQPPAAPTASGGSVTTAFNTPVSVTLPGLGVISSYALKSQPGHGTVSVSGSRATYTPSSGFIGADSFTFVAVGPGGTSAPATITVTVQAPPAPIANSGSITCPYQTTCEATLTSTGLSSTYTLSTQASNGTCSISGSTLTYVPAWGAVGSDSCTFTVTGPGGTSAPATIYITNEPPPLPDPGGSTGTPIPTSGASTAVCSAGQSASIPGLPGPPTGTVYDPNWCNEQVLTIAQQALRLQNQQSQITALQTQVAVQQKMVQRLGSDATSPTLASVNAGAAAILQQATGIGFNAQAAGSAFASAYPGGATVAGFNGSELNAAMQTWQANNAQALQTSIAIQNQIAQSQARVTGAIQGAVNASNAAAGPTAAHQATNQILAAVSTQLNQLQDILIAESQAYVAIAASREQAGGAAGASAVQTQAQIQSALTPAPGVNDTTHM